MFYLCFSSAQELDDGDIPNAKFPKILDGKYYTITERDSSNNIKARCMHCVNKIYSGTILSTGNFFKHISKIHPDLYDDVKDYTRKKDENGEHARDKSINTSTFGLTSNKNVNIILTFIEYFLQTLSISFFHRLKHKLPISL